MSIILKPSPKKGFHHRPALFFLFFFFFDWSFSCLPWLVFLLASYLPSIY